MLSFLHEYASNVHSQNGEDGIISECSDRLELAGWLGRIENNEWRPGNCVEIGGNDGRWMSNTRYLIESGWGGLFVEADYGLYQQCVRNWANHPRVRCQCARVSAQNINAFVTHECDVLSLDTDGSDYQIFQGLNAKPKIVIVEIDSSYPPDVWAFNADGAGTYRNTVELGFEKGYFLLCHTGNLVFAANEYRYLFPEIEGDGLSNAELYFNRAWIKEAA